MFSLFVLAVVAISAARAEPSIAILPVKPNPNLIAPEVCTQYCILPPKQYDHPYKGKLTVETVRSQDDLREACGGSYRPGLTLGCARRSYDGSSCHIYLVPEEIIVARRWTRELMLRHEIGHCNGWSASHEGQRRYDADDTEAQNNPTKPVLRWHGQ